MAGLRVRALLASAWLGWGAAVPARAGEADVVAVEVHCHSEGVCRFDVTVRHDDESWTHYADRWDVLALDGTVLATGSFRQPHVGEQPVSRSLPWVRIPEGVEQVKVRAHDSEHGYGGAERTVAIPPYVPPAPAAD